MARTKANKVQHALLVGLALAGAALAGWLLTHRFQVYTVRSVGGVAGNTFVRSPSRWFASLDGAKQYAAGQMGGVDFMGAFIADRSGGVLEGFHGTFMTGEEIDARLAAFARGGLELDPTVGRVS